MIDHPALYSALDPTKRYLLYLSGVPCSDCPALRQRREDITNHSSIKRQSAFALHFLSSPNKNHGESTATGSDLWR